MAVNSANAADIGQFLASKGLTAPQIAGVLGNFQVESGFNPSEPNAKEGAIGLAQWEGPRRTALDNFASQTGGSETSLATQEGFLWAELNGPEKGSLSALLKQSTAAGAATVFDEDYERSAAASRPTRVADANAIFSKMSAAPGPSQVSAPNGSSIQTAGVEWAKLGSGGIGGTLGNLLNNPFGTVAGAAASDAGSLASSAVGSVWSSAAPDVYRISIGFLAGGLVLAGLYLAAKPAVHSVAGKVSDAAGSAAKLAALA